MYVAMPPIAGNRYKCSYGLYIRDDNGAYLLTDVFPPNEIWFKRASGEIITAWFLSNGQIVSMKPSEFADADIFVEFLQAKLKRRNRNAHRGYYARVRDEFDEKVTRRIIMSADYKFDLHPPSVSVIGNGDLWFILPAQTQEDVDRILEDLRFGRYSRNHLRKRPEYFRRYWKRDNLI